MKYDYILWDFNGTILDDVSIGVDSINTLLARRGLPLLDERRYRSVFTFPVVDYYKAIGLDVDGEGFDLLAHEWVAEYRLREKYARVRTGVCDAIKTFADMGIPQGILSATESRMLIEQTDALGIGKMFDEIFGSDNIYAKSKSDIAIKFMCEHDCTPLLIGDTVHDAEAAKTAGMDCILIFGGHQDENRLRKTGLPIFYGYKELCDYVTKTEDIRV